MSNEKMLQEILENQAIIYAKLIKIEDKLKGTTSTSNKVADAVRAFENLRNDVKRAHSNES
jgi:hypothetical protein